MTEIIADFRQQLLDDYVGALLRIATLRAENEHHLLFGWIELYPFDMTVPDSWNAGDRPWSVPGTDGWTCGFSAKKLSVQQALDWYEAASAGTIEITRVEDKPITAHAVDLGAEPAYGRFCIHVDAPFSFRWHGGPRIHRYVPLSEPPHAVRYLGSNTAAHNWLEQHVGFNPFCFDEWLGGLALVAPDPLTSSADVFPSDRSDDGSETVTIHLVPRRSAERGIADLSKLVMHVADFRTAGCADFRTVEIGREGHTTFTYPQPCAQIAHALVCPKRGVLRLVEPLSMIEQVGVSTNVSNCTLEIQVPSGGRRKPGKTVSVQRYHSASDISVGKALNDPARIRLVSLQQRRKARQERAAAPQMIFGLATDKSSVDDETIRRKRKEAEDFIAALISGAKEKVLFVDPFFGFRETRLFALRASNEGVIPRILTGLPGLKADIEVAPGKSALSGDLLVADLSRLAQIARIRAPEIRIMAGGDRPIVHDRYLIIDDEVWHCGPSFNELGDRLGVMVRLPNPLSLRRCMSSVWSRSAPLVATWQQYQAVSGTAS